MHHPGSLLEMDLLDRIHRIFLLRNSCHFLLQRNLCAKVLSVKTKHLRKTTSIASWQTEYDDPDRTFIKLLKLNLMRPIRMISTQIIIQILAIYMALLYGVMYLVLFTFPLLWSKTYHESTGTGSLNYIATGIGFTLGTQSQ